MFLSFPLLVLPLIAYNLVAFSAGTAWSDEIFRVSMVSGVPWIMTLGDLLMAATLVLLFVEILKATYTGTSSLLDHALSMLVFIAGLVEFLLVAQAATSVFFLLTLVALIDVVAGFSVTIRAARRDLGIDHYPSAHT